MWCDVMWCDSRRGGSSEAAGREAEAGQRRRVAQSDYRPVRKTQHITRGKSLLFTGMWFVATAISYEAPVYQLCCIFVTVFETYSRTGVRTWCCRRLLWRIASTANSTLTPHPSSLLARLPSLLHCRIQSPLLAEQQSPPIPYPPSSFPSLFSSPPIPLFFL